MTGSETIAQPLPASSEKAFTLALWLAVITIFYNIVEGLVSVYWGVSDETISLFGFGLDSFVEVISGAGILHMILRIRRSADDHFDQFERTALRITGTAFYILTASLVLTAAVQIFSGHKPETTLGGVIISLISILTMGVLIHFKLRAGRALNSQAIIADANCTKACLYLSVVLLAASLGYMLTGFGGVDSLGALGIAFFSAKEGREAFEKAKGVVCGCS